MSNEYKNKELPDSLSSLDDQKKAYTPKQQYEQVQKLKKRITMLEDVLSLYNDADRIAMMEQVLIENGLMSVVEKRTITVFVSVKRLEEQRKKTAYYKQLLEIQTKNCLQLEGTIRLLQNNKKI